MASTAALRIGSIPLRIHASFLITAVVLNFTLVNHLAFLVAWAAIVFVSVLIHELGHALMGKAFGLSPEIDLHGMGGTTSWRAGRNLSHGRSILVSLAGPGVGFLVGGAIFGLRSIGALDGLMFDPDGHANIGAFVVGALIEVNVFWGIFNVLPMLPLDGGNVLRAALLSRMKLPARAERTARIVSILTALGVGAYMATQQQWYVVILGALFAGQNFRALQMMSAQKADVDLKKPFDEAYAALEREDGHGVILIAQAILDRAKTDDVRAEAVHLLAYGLLLEHRVNDADRMMARLPRGYGAHPSYEELKKKVAERDLNVN